MVRDYSVGEKNHIDWRFVRFWRGKSFGWRVNFSIVDKKGWASESLGKLSHGFVFTNVKTARRVWLWKENLFSMVRDYSVGEKNHIDWRFVRFWRGKSFGWRVNFSIVDKKGWTSECWGNCHTDSFLLT